MPALSIPVDAKSDFSVPSTHLDAFRACIQTVSTVLAIGWRATEEHFLSTLEDALGDPRTAWIIVSPRQATIDAVVERLSAHNLGSSFDGHTAAFSDYLDGPPLSALLREV
jgi:hypothetical protein